SRRPAYDLYDGETRICTRTIRENAHGQKIHYWGRDRQGPTTNPGQMEQEILQQRDQRAPAGLQIRRALFVLRRQLALRVRLQHEGRIHHDQLFLKDNGESIRNLLYPYVRWRQTLERLRTIR